MGFTLIELMIVIMVIGLLLTIMLPNLINAKFQAQYSACTHNLRAIAAGMEVYKTNEKGYPQSLRDLYQGQYVVPVPRCPSNGNGYESSYTVNNREQVYTIDCPGVHYQVLNEVPRGYPKYSNETGLVLK